MKDVYSSSACSRSFVLLTLCETITQKDGKKAGNKSMDVVHALLELITNLLLNQCVTKNIYVVSEGVVV